jgi:hypothetical protein
MPGADVMASEEMVVTHRVNKDASGRTTVTFSSRGTQSSSSELPQSAAPSLPPSLPAPPPPRKASYGFRIVSLADLPFHAKSRIKVRTRDGREHVGELVKVNKDSLTLRKRMSGGQFDFDVSTRGITEIKVWGQIST